MLAETFHSKLHYILIIILFILIYKRKLGGSLMALRITKKYLPILDAYYLRGRGMIQVVVQILMYFIYSTMQDIKE